MLLPNCWLYLVTFVQLHLSPNILFIQFNWHQSKGTISTLWIHFVARSCHQSWECLSYTEIECNSFFSFNIRYTRDTIFLKRNISCFFQQKFLKHNTWSKSSAIGGVCISSNLIGLLVLDLDMFTRVVSAYNILTWVWQWIQLCSVHYRICCATGVCIL